MATNTVPIEIVLQDPNNPIVPPSPDPVSPDDPGENTNILVPDTALGTGTTKDGNGTNGIFSGTNATASIASIIVLVLALGAIITLLVRRYQKHKKAQQGQVQSIAKSTTSRKEKLLAATSGTLAVLAATVLVGNLLITSTNAATNNENNISNEGTVLTTPDKIQIIANRYDDVTIVASTKAVSYASTDTTFGYKIFMSMVGEDANLYLDGDNASEYYFAPTTRAGLSNNSWGYSLDDGAEQAMPLASDPIVAQQTTEVVEDEEFTVYYTMKADKDMPFGVYSGEIAYDIQGYNGFLSTLTTMQQMTPEICAAVYTPSGTETIVPTATLTDTRDDKTYKVAKLADGKCWMTQNLDLQKEDLLAGVTLDDANTDHPATGFTLPTSQTDGDGIWGSSSAQIDVETAHAYDIAASGTTYKYCLDYQGNYCAAEGDEIPTAELGNIYNWYAATAGTGTFSVGSGDDKQATGSICPAGWRLPNNSNNSEATDYSKLLYLYGITKDAADSTYVSADKTAIYKAPLSLVPTGDYYRGLGAVGMRGSLWSSLSISQYGSTFAKNFSFSSGSVAPWTFDAKTAGKAVRCIAQ